MVQHERVSKGFALTAAGVAVGFALVSVASGGMVVVPPLPTLDLAVGLAVPLALLFGPVAALGVAVGVVLAAAVQSSLSWWTVLDAISYAILAYTAHRLWGVLPAVSTGADPTLRSGAQWVEFVLVSTLAAVTAVAVLAWGSLVVWGGLFHAILFSELGIAILSTIVVGPAVIAPVSALLDERGATYSDRVPLERGSGGFRGAVLTPVLWVGFGSAASICSGVVQVVGAATFARHGLELAFLPFDPAIVGYGGRRVLIVFGAVMLSLVVATYVPSSSIATDDRSSKTVPPVES